MTTELREPVQSPIFNVVGVSHRTLPLDERECLARRSYSSPELLRRIALQCRVPEIAVLSTCNRFEVVSAGANAEERIVDFISHEMLHPLQPKSLYRYRNTDAFRHIFRVASSLDSMVVGEAQILGQVKEAYRNAALSGCAGKYLHHLFQYAFRLAKRVRTSTGIAERGVSVSYVGVKLAQQIFGSLNGRKVMVIGCGQMAEIAAVHLKSYGCTGIMVANRTIEKAADLALRIGGTAISLPEIETRLDEVDVVIGSISVDRPVLRISSVKRRVRGRPLFLIDLGVPRNFSPALAELDDVYLYNVDDLAAIAAQNSELRAEAAHDAEVIIDYGVAQFERWVQRMSAEPALVDFRRRVAAICENEILTHLGPSDPSGNLPNVISRLSHRISQKVLHNLNEVVAGTAFREIDDDLPLLALLFKDQ